MKRFILSTLFAGLTFISAGEITPASASTDLDELCAKFPLNSQCDGYVAPSDEEGEEGEYQVINTGDWRSSGDIPFSKPVIVRDAFDGDYLAVIDKNFSGNLRFGQYQEGVITNWSEDYIRVFAYATQRICGAWRCRDVSESRETNRMEVKIGDEVFRMEGENGNFPVSSELAAALRNAPAGQAIMRISLEGLGSEIVNDIGAGTVEAWRIVYQEETEEM